MLSVPCFCPPSAPKQNRRMGALRTHGHTVHNFCDGAVKSASACPLAMPVGTTLS